MQSKLVALLISVSLIGVWGGVAVGQDGEIDTPAISIAEAVICRDVENRTPVGAGDVFPSDVERLFCFVRVVGAASETQVQHKWFYQDQLVATVTLPVRSENWRTYSSKQIGAGMTGEWMVEIGSDQGAILKKIIFVVE